MPRELNRRDFVQTVAVGAAASATLQNTATAQRSQRTDHYATGSSIAVTSTSREATAAALWALGEGGNAADAYMTAAIAQTVSEPGLTSIGGGFGIRNFDAKLKKTTGIVGRLGPAKDEEYDFDRQSPVTQTGRAMPVPGFLAGVYETHRKHGKLPWSSLFAPAIGYAENGVLVNPKIIEAAKRRGVRHPEGRQIWARNGRMLQTDQPLVQPKVAVVLRTVAKEGPQAFYEGEFAEHYVDRAQADGGKITLGDLKTWKELVISRTHQPAGDYCGQQVMSADLIIYALHLNEALDLRASGNTTANPESVYKQIRIMEEVFLSTKDYSQENDGRFADPAYARERADFVLNSKPRRLTLDAIFNTCFLVVRDKDGNCAWGTHSINTPTSFGAGIVVDGVYASHAINRNHVHGSGAAAPGISTSFALFKDGTPHLIVGSPGFGFVHGPYQYGTGIVEWDLSAAAAMNLPRFSLPNHEGKALFEQHYDRAVFEMLDQRKIGYTRGRPSTSTGLVGALSIDDEDHLHVVQDGRRSGFARAG